MRIRCTVFLNYVFNDYYCLLVYCKPCATLMTYPRMCMQNGSSLYYNSQSFQFAKQHMYCFAVIMHSDYIYCHLASGMFITLRGYLNSNFIGFQSVE